MQLKGNVLASRLNTGACPKGHGGGCL